MNHHFIVHTNTHTHHTQNTHLDDPYIFLNESSGSHFKLPHRTILICVNFNLTPTFLTVYFWTAEILHDTLQKLRRTYICTSRYFRLQEHNALPPKKKKSRKPSSGCSTDKDFSWHDSVFFLCFTLIFITLRVSVGEWYARFSHSIYDFTCYQTPKDKMSRSIFLS